MSTTGTFLISVLLKITWPILKLKKYVTTDKFKSWKFSNKNFPQRALPSVTLISKCLISVLVGFKFVFVLNQCFISVHLNFMLIVFLPHHITSSVHPVVSSGHDSGHCPPLLSIGCICLTFLQCVFSDAHRVSPTSVTSWGQPVMSTSRWHESPSAAQIGPHTAHHHHHHQHQYHHQHQHHH